MTTETGTLFSAPEIASLSMAYSDAVAQASALFEGDYFGSSPAGPRISVQIPDRQWQKLATAICAITGGEVV